MVYRDTVGILTHTKSVDSFILRLISHLVYFVRTTTMSRLTCGRWDASMLSCCKCWIQSQISGAGGHFDVHVPSHLPADPRKALIMRTLHSFFCVRTAVLSVSQINIGMSTMKKHLAGSWSALPWIFVLSALSRPEA